MEQFQKYELKRINHHSDEYEIVIHLADHLSEFANELGTLPRERKDVVTLAKQIVRERYPKIKVTMVKVIIGGIAVTSLPLMGGKESSAQAAASTTAITQVSSDGSIYYHVSSGDSLWSVSRKFNTNIDNIKRANHLTSDILKVNQRLIIPKAYHTVGTGDYLAVLAKKYGITVGAIKEANGLTSDSTRLGQELIIPVLIGGQTSHPAPAQVNTPQTPPITQTPEDQTTSYTVVAGDSLSVIAKRFGTTVDALRNENQLTTDMLRIGQSLKIPGKGTNTLGTESAPADATRTYTVIAGDSLSVIAKRFNTTIGAIKDANKLTSDVLHTGQTLIIPKINLTTELTPAPAVQEERMTFAYAVQSGDSLSAIANRFEVTTDAIRSASRLTSDFLQVGQVLTIPNGLHAPSQSGANSITYTTHTVVSGDNIWSLSVKYGIPQTELIRVNNLTMNSVLSIGQKLTIPVHNIPVKEVVGEKYGEYLDWFTEAQYVLPIGTKAKVTDFATGKSFYIARTIGANHADSETLTINDTNIAKSIWGGFSWKPRAVIVEVGGRKLAGSMTFYPHEQDTIANNGITGHFDVYFGNSIRHVDGKKDPAHQVQVERAAGLH